MWHNLLLFFMKHKIFNHLFSNNFLFKKPYIFFGICDTIYFTFSFILFYMYNTFISQKIKAVFIVMYFIHPSFLIYNFFAYIFMYE